MFSRLLWTCSRCRGLGQTCSASQARPLLGKQAARQVQAATVDQRLQGVLGGGAAGQQAAAVLDQAAPAADVHRRDPDDRHHLQQQQFGQFLGIDAVVLAFGFAQVPRVGRHDPAGDAAELVVQPADPAGGLEADLPGLSRLDPVGHAAGQLAVELVPGALEAVGVDLVALGIQHVHGPLPLVYVQSHAIISHSKPPLVLT